MWFRRFRRGVGRGRGGRELPPGPEVRRDAGLVDEVEAFLAGRLADRFVRAGRPVPAWAALNRLAHGDYDELLRLVAGVRLARLGHPADEPPVWMVAERFVAGRLLARARTTEELAAVQRDILVPVELALMRRCEVEDLTPEQAIEAGAQAIDARRSGA